MRHHHALLTLKRNSTRSEFDPMSVVIDRLEESRTERAMDIHSAPDHRLDHAFCVFLNHPGFVGEPLV